MCPETVHSPVNLTAAQELFGDLGFGDRLRQPDLAETLELIAREGPAAFYRGEVAARIAQCSADLGGLLAADDLAQHEGIWQQAISAPFAGYDVMTMPPNSFGLTLLLQLLDPVGARSGRTDVAAMVAGFRCRRGCLPQ